jgi:polyisoprenoid-binding protein YceI
MKKIVSLSAAIVVSAIVMMAFTSVKIKVNNGANSQSPDVPLAAKWVVDKVHTNVIFSVSHLVVSDVEGKFKSFDGSLESDKPDFTDAKIIFTVDVSSVNTDNDMRDNHLKSDDFFNAAKFPQIKFESTSFQPTGGNKYKLSGNLTIRDVTKPIVFDVTFGGVANAMGGTHAGFKAKATINRFDYNLKWSATTEAGGLVVGKDVDITINVDFKKL